MAGHGRCKGGGPESTIVGSPCRCCMFLPQNQVCSSVEHSALKTLCAGAILDGQANPVRPTEPWKTDAALQDSLVFVETVK